MVDSTTLRKAIELSRQERAQRLCESAERIIILDNLLRAGAERLAHQDEWRKQVTGTSTSHTSQVSATTEIALWNQAIRENLDDAAKRLLTVQTLLDSIEQRFKRVESSLMCAEEHLYQAEDRIWRIKSEQVEQRIQEDANGAHTAWTWTLRRDSKRPFTVAHEK